MRRGMDFKVSVNMKAIYKEVLSQEFLASVDTL